MNKEEKIQNIIIENKKIQTQIRELDIFQLKYFVENPRINYLISKSNNNNNIDQENINESLWKLESVKDLYHQIEINGGLLEEIIVMGDKVVEGNSRLCAYRHLYANAPEGQKQKWRYIRSKVILEDLNSKELFLLLGNLHITGKTEWDPFEIANYIYKTINEDGLSVKEVAVMLGMKQATIETKLKAYGLMSEKYLPSLPSTEIAADHLNKFSMFEEYCKSAPLQKLKNEAPEVINDDKFTDWVLEGRVKSAAYDVRKDLPSILKDKGSRKVFFNTESTDAISESRKVLYVDRPEENNGTLKKIKDMTDFLEEIEIGEFKNSLADNERAIKTIKKFKSTVNDFCNKLDINKQNGGFLKRLSGNRKLKFV